MPSFEIRI